MHAPSSLFSIMTQSEAAVSDLLAQLLALKQEGHDEWDDGFAAGALRILELKRVHRALCESTEALREATSDAKTQLDQSGLQLQNLLYEKQHYEKEIASCRAFKSAYSEQQLELLPQHQFVSIKAVKEQGLASDDPHQLMLNRLAHELTWRQGTLKELDALKAQRDGLAAEVAQKRSAVGGLEAEVSRLRAAAQKVAQQYSVAATEAADAADGTAAAGATAGEQQQPQQAAAESMEEGEAGAAAQQPVAAG